MHRPFIALLAFLLLAAAPAAADTAKAVHRRAAEAVAVEAKAQEEYRRWNDRKQSMAAEIRDMKAMEAWLRFQNEKYDAYVRKQQQVIAELERRKQEARRIRMELEPFLETVVQRLEQFVADDLPFLPEERSQRIVFLRESLDDYHLDLSEKLRRVFEALHVETEYGRNVAVTEREIELDGQPTQVTVFRLGRTALYYQAEGAGAAGVWDRSSGSWRALDDEFARTLRRAGEMAQRKRAVELLTLPLPVPGPREAMPASAPGDQTDDIQTTEIQTTDLRASNDRPDPGAIQ